MSGCEGADKGSAQDWPADCVGGGLSPRRGTQGKMSLEARGQLCGGWALLGKCSGGHQLHRAGTQGTEFVYQKCARKES